MIINILDLRADHQAIDPIDAAVIGHELEMDESGVLRAEQRWDIRRLRLDVTLTEAITWASAKSEQVVLLLFDAESQCTLLAEERMSRKLARELTLAEACVLLPSGLAWTIEQGKNAADTTSA